jgi:hypothetical protein
MKKVMERTQFVPGGTQNENSKIRDAGGGSASGDTDFSLWADHHI